LDCRWKDGLLCTLAVAMFLALGVVNLYWGDLNQDEGWYLYAGRAVSDGRMPYRDFAFTQGPVMAFGYALAQPLVERFGLAGGRGFTLALSLLTLLLAGRLAAQAAPAGRGSLAFLLTVILLGVNVYHSYFTTIVKTYSLCGLLLTAGLLILCRGGPGRWWPAAAAGVLLAGAAGTRISAGAAMPVVFLFLLARRKAWGDAGWLGFGVGGGLALLALFLPFAFIAPDGFRFAVLDYHAARSTGGWLSTLVYKAGFLSRFVQGYFVFFGLLLALALSRAGTGHGAPSDPRNRTCLLGLAGGATTLLHFLAPFPYDDYQAFVMPVLAAAVAAAWAGRLPDSDSSGRWRRLILGLTFLLSIAAAGSSPINQGWVVYGQDRIWWRLKGQSAVAQLREAGRAVRALAGPDGQVLTQDAYVAVESGLKLPPGLEMGPFSYYPGWSTEKARTLRVLNEELMTELLSNTEASVAALSGYSLSIASPSVTELPAAEQDRLWALVRRRFQEVQAVPDFGQARTTLRVLRRNEGVGAASP
jgi:hypothetical protein